MKGENLLLTAALLVVIFLIGLFIGQIFYFYTAGSITDSTANAPSDFVTNREILVYPDRVVIKLDNAHLSSYAPTNSMVPILGEKANGISLKPNSDAQINVGDIVSFKKGNDIIVHRVVEKGIDNEGVYFITRGDNVSLPDGKIRFEDINGVLVGVIY